MRITTDLLQDPRNIRQWYDEVLPGINTIVVRDGGDSDEGTDLFQDALSILYQKASQGPFEINGSIEAYVFGICRKLWLMRIRRKGVERKYLKEHVASGITKESDDAHAELQKELIYETHFQQLGKQCQDILRLFYEKISFREITARLGLKSEGYAKKLKFQCKKKLMDEVRKDPMYSELADT